MSGRRGLAPPPPTSYLVDVKAYFARFAPLRAINDLRHFMALQKPAHVVFLILSIVITTLVIVAFRIDSHFEREYKQDIIYVKNWRADRSEAEIRAGQLRDMALKARTDAIRDKAQADRQAGFQRLDDKLEKWGI